MRKIVMLAGFFMLSLLLIIIIGCEREVTNVDDGDGQEFTSCFTCHGDEGILLAAKGEWQNSVHASGNNVDYTNRGGQECTQCHNHQGFLEFVQTGEVSPPYNQVSAIHCFTCHAPHTRGDLSLRVSSAFTLADGSTFDHGSANLCANCHHSRQSSAVIADGISVHRYWGPHLGPQGDLLTGANGYEFAGETYESEHAHATNYTGDGCIGCHMGNPQTHIGYEIGGHSFNMVNEETDETLVGVCQGDDENACHASAESFDYEGIQTEVDSLLDELEVLLIAAGVLSDDQHPLSGTIADGNVAGAMYNFLVVYEDRSLGVHNPDYIRGLLETSISYMESLDSPVLVQRTPTPFYNGVITSH